MSPRSNSKQANIRARVAQEAARLMIESGVSDYQAAKRKAAERLRVVDARSLPRNDEIEAARSTYQRLFRADRQPAHLRRLRGLAVEAMEFLAPFRPKLVGPVLAGTADEHSAITLHAFVDAPEEIAIFLHDHHFAFEDDERRVRVSSEEFLRLPVACFLVEDVPVEIVVFHGRARRQTPLSPVDGRAMERAGVGRVRELLAVESVA